MKHLLLISASTIAVCVAAPAFSRTVVTDTTGPNVTDTSGPNVTDPSGGNVTDPTGGNVTDSGKPGKRFVGNRNLVRDGQRISKQLREAQTKCASGGDCTELNRLYSEGQKYREELKREKPVRFNGNRLW
jgi:hypothetical protein